MNDVFSPAPRGRYAALWADPHPLTVLLRPSLPVAQRRAAARDKQVPVKVIAGLYEQIPPDAFELAIDNSRVSVAGVATWFSATHNEAKPTDTAPTGQTQRAPTAASPGHDRRRAPGVGGQPAREGHELVEQALRAGWLGHDRGGGDLQLN